MDTTREDSMIRAHKAGIAEYKHNPQQTISTVAHNAKHCFATVHEQDAYVAGFIGARTRDLPR